MVVKWRILFNDEIPCDIVSVSNVYLLNFIGLLKRFSVIRVGIKTSIASIFTFSKVRSFQLKYDYLFIFVQN